MRVQSLIDAIERLAPPAAAEPWDRNGLQLGRPSRDLSGPVLLTIDLTEAVLDEAIDAGAGAIIAYHCPIWNPLTTLTDRTPAERIILRAAEAGIAIYSPHTALDAAPGGVTDWLCEGLSGGESTDATGRIAGDCRALTAHLATAEGEQVKIVTFLTADALEPVRNALATAGAGRIGNYTLCSFTVSGTGTFLGSDDAHPAIGEPGKLEQIQEHRLEMVCSRRSLPIAVETLREFHPYEEPAFDIMKLEPKPMRRVGTGRKLVLDRAAGMTTLCERLKNHLGRSRVRYALANNRTPDTPVSAIGVVPGAGESLIDRAAAEGCELFVTGEMKHHEVLRAVNLGLSVIVAGHTNTERGYLPRLRARLLELLPEAKIMVSSCDCDLMVVA